MNQTVPTTIRARDIAIGFFGWIIFHSLFFIGMLGMGQHFHFIGRFGWIVILWLPFVIAPPVVFVNKRIWMGSGTVAAIIINMAIWILLDLAYGLPYWSPWAYLAFPFPLGLGLFMQ